MSAGISDLITVEDTIELFLKQQLPGNTRFSELNLNMDDILFYRGGYSLAIKTPCFSINASPWNVSKNPFSQWGAMEDSGICEVRFMLERQKRAKQELDIRKLGIAVQQTLNSVAGMVDGTSSQEIIGWAKRLDVKQSVTGSELTVEDDRDRVFRVALVEYEFRIFNNT
jgi:hypothetical protein